MQVSNNLREQVRQLQKSFELGVEMTGHLLTYLDQYPEFENVIMNHMASIHTHVIGSLFTITSSLLKKIEVPHAND